MKVINKETLYVAFNGQQVAVSSNIPEVIELIERGFSEMLEPEPGRITGRLEAFDEGEKYHLAGNSIASEEYRSLDDILDLFSKEVIHHMIQANPKFLWLHAGAAAYLGYSVVFPGAWGRGKSTIVTSLCEDGWAYLSDDIVPIDPNSGMVIPFFRTPTVRKNSGQEVPIHRVGELEKLEIDLKRKSLCREPMPVGAIVFPFYRHGSPARIESYSPAATALELLGSCLNYENHREEAVNHLCGLVKHLPTFRLYFSSSKNAAELINQAHKDWYSI